MMQYLRAGNSGTLATPRPDVIRTRRGESHREAFRPRRQSATPSLLGRKGKLEE